MYEAASKMGKEKGKMPWGFLIFKENYHLSKRALRPEKNCLNCGATVEHRFCPACGQENLPPREGFVHMVTHFVFDLFHFDGKFFETFKFLMRQPGFLSTEHLLGRRAAYLHPIRLYVFTSAFFFLIFFSFYNVEEEITINEAPKQTVNAWMKKRDKAVKELNKAIKIAQGLEQKNIVDSLTKAVALYKEDSILMRKDSVAAFTKPSVLARNSQSDFFNFGGDTTHYASEAAYDSLQMTLPAAKRNNWLVRQLYKKNIHLKDKYKGDNDALMKAVVNKFKHLLPQTFFTSLPLFALLLQLLYVRRRKSFFYVDHLVYSIHLYCAIFILTLLGMLLDSVLTWVLSSKDTIVAILFLLLCAWYGYKAQRRFYGQSRAKTLLKYFLLGFLFLFVMVFVFTFFFLGSALTL